MNSNDVINRTGQLLLNGWKLLAISCPVCNTALLSSRGGEMQCPGCNLPVVLESKESQPAPTATGNCAPVDINIKSTIQQFNTNNVSKLIGERLLQGWAMTNEVCDNLDCRGTPLMRDPSSLSKLCVNCGMDYVKKTDTTAGGPDEADDFSDDVLFDDSPIVNFEKRDHNGDDPSQYIAKMLLKGWCLLDVCCNSSTCNGRVPLMRNLKGEVSSVRLLHPLYGMIYLLCADHV